jgi:undecaprenyl diphosphate synthase
VRLRFIGQRHRFSERLQRLMTHAENRYRRTIAQLRWLLPWITAVSWDIACAARALAEQARTAASIRRRSTQELFGSGIWLSANFRHRTCASAPAAMHGSATSCSGTFAYTELYFTPVLWPDFGELEFARALADYGRRERRFGGRGEPDGIVAGGGLDA